jgi:hypothetical protein
MTRVLIPTGLTRGGGGANALPLFFLPRKFFFLPSSREALKKQQYFRNDYWGGETGKKKEENLRVTGCGIEASEFQTAIANLPPPSPIVIRQVTPMLFPNPYFLKFPTTMVKTWREYKSGNRALEKT